MTLVWRPGYMPLDDPDAETYIAAVEAADEAASPGVGVLEDEVKAAIHAFVKGCKVDGIWPAIKASCILAGARTLDGALVPLVGPVPVNTYYTSTNYHRKNGITYVSPNTINSNYLSSSVPVNSIHLSYFGDYAGPTMGEGDIGTNATNLTVDIAASRCRSSANLLTTASAINNFLGLTRSSATAYTVRNAGIDIPYTVASQGSNNNYIVIFGRPGTTTAAKRCAFYSIGESLDLAKLDARVTDLITAIGAAF